MLDRAGIVILPGGLVSVIIELGQGWVPGATFLDHSSRDWYKPGFLPLLIAQSVCSHVTSGVSSAWSSNQIVVYSHVTFVYIYIQKS